MRVVFGVLSLLVVLAIVGSLAKKQLQAVNGVSTRMSSPAVVEAERDAATPGTRDGATLGIPGGMPGATAADTSGLTVPEQSRNIQQQFGDNTAAALQQGVDRNARAAP
jgi:hypothetical protein